MLSTAAEGLATKPPQRQSPAAWCTFQERRDAHGAFLWGTHGTDGTQNPPNWSLWGKQSFEVP